MKVLITGAFGFVGNNLSKYLSKNQHTLIAVDIFEPKTHYYDYFYLWNELEKIKWSSIDAIIHLAGIAHDTKNRTNELVYYNVNVGLTKTIIEYFLNSNAKQFIFFSSVKAVADKVGENVLTEDVKPNPGTIYGKSKFDAETIINKKINDWISHNRIIPNKNAYKYNENYQGKKIYILRPCMIHGEGNKGNLNLLYKAVLKGFPWPLGDFNNKRSFTSIGNLQFIIQQILEKDIEPGTYQVADDETLSTNNLIDLIAKSQGKKAKIWKINTKIIKVIANIGDKLNLPLNSDRLMKLTGSYIVSNSKIKNALSIEKMPISAEDGLIKTFSSF